jgi:hypothetical protein
MILDILTPIITGVFGLATGYFGALSIWQVEKLKMRRNERISLIKELREYIASDEFNTQKFKNTILYSRFRKYLSDQIIDQIDCKDGAIRLELHIAESRDGLQNELLDQLCVLEEKLNLI